MKTQRGISMIEVVVTIAIMGILMAAAMPSVGDWMRNSRVRNTAESIQNGLQQARMEAVRQNKAVSLYMVSDLTNACTLSNTVGSWVVASTSPVGACASAKIKGLVADGGGGAATIKATQSDGTTDATSVTFSGLGMLAQSSAATAIRRVQVKTTDGSFENRVEVSPAGLIRMCDPTKTLSDGDSRKCTQ